MSLESIAQEVIAEVRRACELHPYSVSLPNGTARSTPNYLDLIIARQEYEDAKKAGKLTHAAILREEVCEALVETEDEPLREELKQVAAMAMKWMEDIDRRKK